MNSNRMTLQKWYANSIMVPNFSSFFFKNFVASSVGIIRSVVKEKMNLNKISVSFAAIDTAYADQEKGNIVIGEHFLDGKLNREDKKFVYNSDTSISIILGIVVHEAGHFAYSPATLMPFADYVKANTTVKFCERLALILGNVVEDIFIEAEIERTVPNLHWMLETINEAMFDSKDEAKRYAKVKDINVAPATLDEVGDVVSVLILAKTRNIPMSTPWVNRLFRMARTATIAMTLEERLDLTLAIYDDLMHNCQQAEQDSNQDKGQGQGEGEGEGDGEGEGEGEGKGQGRSQGSGKPRQTGTIIASFQEERELKDLMEKAEGITSGHVLVNTDFADRAYTPRHDVKDVNNGIVQMSDLIVYINEDVSGMHTPCNLYFEEALTIPKRAIEPIQVDPRYAALAEIGRQRAAVNRPYGMDKTRGHNIRKLYRIGTDQKIFAEPVRMTEYKPMQVLVLIDCSGSMNSPIERKGISRIEAASQAGLGAALALSAARCDVAVYGHTADVHGVDVMIYRAKGFTEPLAGLDSKLSQLGVRGSIRRANNRDGYAVAYVGKKFTNRDKRRLLIVISDGQPAGTGYGGHEAIKHGKEVVDKLRKDGVDVMCISITEHAKFANDAMYGESNNVYNQDPNAIRDIIQVILTK